jgi:hypothetical protein
VRTVVDVFHIAVFEGCNRRIPRHHVHAVVEGVRPIGPVRGAGHGTHLCASDLSARPHGNDSHNTLAHGFTCHGADTDAPTPGAA